MQIFEALYEELFGKFHFDWMRFLSLTPISCASQHNQLILRLMKKKLNHGTCHCVDAITFQVISVVTCINPIDVNLTTLISDRMMGCW